MSTKPSEKWKPVQFFIPVSLNEALDKFVGEALKEGMSDLLDNDHGYIPKHGWKSRVVVAAIKEYIAARRGK